MTIFNIVFGILMFLSVFGGFLTKDDDKVIAIMALSLSGLIIMAIISIFIK